MFLVYYPKLVRKKQKVFIEKLQKEIATIPDTEEDLAQSEEVKELLKDYHKIFVKPDTLRMAIIAIEAIIAIILIFLTT